MLDYKVNTITNNFTIYVIRSLIQIFSPLSTCHEFVLWLLIHTKTIFAAQGSAPVSGRTVMKAGLWFFSRYSWWVVSAHFCCCTKSHRQDDLNHQHLFLSLEAEKSKIKVPEGLMSGEVCLPALQMAAFLLCLCTAEREGGRERGGKRERVSEF